jgi:16S rRNA (uracil1498-N3)-methyltransferase
MNTTSYKPRIRLYIASEAPLAEGLQVTLSKPQTHYLTQVMRQREGSIICVFDGRSGEWSASLADAASKQARLQIADCLRPQESEPDIWAVFAPIKSARLEWMVEKATEMGVSAILPVLTARTIVDKINAEKWQAHLIEAAEQSERLTLPVLHPLQKLSALLAQWPQERLLIYADETHQGKSPLTLFAATKKPEKSALLIGPEGGFTPEELMRLRGHPQAVAMSLGKRILRADTALVAGLAAMMTTLSVW